MDGTDGSIRSRGGDRTQPRIRPDVALPGVSGIPMRRPEGNGAFEGPPRPESGEPYCRKRDRGMTSGTALSVTRIPVDRLASDGRSGYPEGHQVPELRQLGQAVSPAFPGDPPAGLPGHPDADLPHGDCGSVTGMRRLSDWRYPRPPSTRTSGLGPCRSRRGRWSRLSDERSPTSGRRQ